MKRRQFLMWLKCVVFKGKPELMPDKFVAFIGKCLFPLQAFYERQSGMRRDNFYNHYYLMGYKISAWELHRFLYEKGTKQ